MSAPVLGLLVWQAYDRTENDVTAIEQSALDRARLVAGDTLRVLDESRHVLATLAARPLVRVVDPTRCDPSLAAQISMDADFASIVVVDPAGRAVCWQGPSPSAMPVLGADESWLREAIRSEGFSIGEAEVDQNGRWVVVLALPLHDSTGRLSGAIAVPVGLAHFGPIVAETALLPGETLTLANGTGVVLARQPDPAQWVGTDIRDTDIGHIVLAGGERIVQVRGIDGTERVFGFTTVPGTDWHVYAGIPLTRVLAIWQSGIALMIALLTVGLVLAAGLALLGGRWIGRPVHVLAAAADAVAAGDLSARVEVAGSSEMAVLAERFNEMVERRSSTEMDLRQSERHLAEAQRIAHLGSWEWDISSDRLRWSDEMYRIFDIAPGTFGGTNDAWLASIHPDDRARSAEADRATLMDGAPYIFDYRIVRPDGTERRIHEEGEVIRDSSGRPIQTVGTAQDVTERVAAEEERAQLEEGLRASERSLVEAQRIAHIGSWERDVATDTYHVSDELLRICGLAREAFDGTLAAVLGTIHPDDRTKAVRSLADLASGELGGLEYRIVRPDGVPRIVHEEAEVIRDAAGTPTWYVGSLQDITERVAAEEERDRLLLAIEQTADPIWTTDPDGTIVYVNRALERLSGYRADELLGQNARIFRSDRPDRVFFADLWATIGSGRTWAGSFRNLRKDGALIEVESVISPIHDAAGRLTSYIQTDRDVTRERELESALERDARERETIEAALERIDPEAAPDVIAAAACAEIIRLPEIGSAFVIGLWSDHGRILAETGLVAQAFTAGTAIPEARARYLLERAAGGSWSERWQTRPEDGAYGELIASTGVHTAVYAPLKGSRGVVGVIGFAVHDPANADRIVERLPALATFGSIVGALIAPGLEARHRDDDARASIQAIIDAGAFRPFFQPIVDLRTGAVVGYEALSRFADGTRPDIVFGMAIRAGLGIELEMTTLRAALAAAASLPAAVYLSLNASPALIGSGVLRALLAGTERLIALEITEHVVVDDYLVLRRELEALGPKVRLAVDDAGAGYSSLRHILELAPDFVKLDIGLVRGIDSDPARQALIAGMGYFAMKRKVRLIAEGIETAAELETLRSLGITYGQGYLLGRPQDGRGPGPWPSRIAVPNEGTA